jgi:hypothetical protein
MANTYAWVLPQGCLETAPSADGLTDVVQRVNWRRSATTFFGGEEIYTDIYGQYACGAPSPDDFTAYADLTQADVEKWLEDGLDVAALDASLDAQLENIINPKIVVLPNPWQSNLANPSK